MSDDLRTLFERFEADSLARTRPPGALAVQRTVRRRYATRAALALAAAIAIILSVLLPYALTPRTHEPIGPVTSAPFSAGVQPTASPTPTPTPPPTSPSASPSASPSPRPDGTYETGNACDPNNFEFFGQNLESPSPDVYQVPGGMLSTCPNIAVRMHRAVYQAAGAQSSTLSRSSSTTVVLDGANRSVTMSTALPAPSCASVLIVVYEAQADPPATMPNDVPKMISSGGHADVDAFLSATGEKVYAASAQAPTC
jgi:hypothetical protein